MKIREKGCTGCSGPMLVLVPQTAEEIAAFDRVAKETKHHLTGTFIMHDTEPGVIVMHMLIGKRSAIDEVLKGWEVTSTCKLGDGSQN